MVKAGRGEAGRGSIAWIGYSVNKDTGDSAVRVKTSKQFTVNQAGETERERLSSESCKSSITKVLSGLRLVALASR